MNVTVRRPFRLALAFSLLLHLTALTVPGWRLPLLEDEEPQEILDATLVVPVQTQPQAQPKSLPKPVPKPRPQPPATPPVSHAVTEPMPVAETAAAAEPAFVPETPLAPEPPSAAVPPAPTFAYASLWPKNGRIAYQITRGDGGLIVGQGEHHWTHDEQNYELYAVAETVGLAALFRPVQVTQSSRGNFTATGLQPLEFKTERDGKPQANVRFDAPEDASLQVQDMLSLFYQLGAVAFDVPEFAIKVHTGRKIAKFVIRVGETQTLDLPLGTFSVRHLKVTGGKGDDSTEIWLDSVSRLPLKIRHRDRKGEVFDQIATTITLEKTE
jgi:Protein of unknown function (DUF3108)